MTLYTVTLPMFLTRYSPTRLESALKMPLLQIRLVVEEGLNCLPSFKQVVTTPTGKVIRMLVQKGSTYCCVKPPESTCASHFTGCEYEGEWFEKNNCAVSILRSGK